MYRDRKEPYVHKDPLAPAYFQTHAPSEWVSNRADCERYAAIYGDASLAKAVAFYKVAENQDPVWVAGTYWEKRLGEAIWKCEEAPPKPEGIPAPGISDVNAEILRRLEEIRDILLYK